MSISEIDPMTGKEWITWTPDKLKKFKKAYEKARVKHVNSECSFMFEGHEFVIGYSVYLIEHLNNQFGNKK
jgi:hypothetical protein